MKRMIFALCAMLMVVGNAMCQTKTVIVTESVNRSRESADKAYLQEQQQELLQDDERRKNTIFSDVLVRDVNEYLNKGIPIKKTEFETTEAFNKRLGDSTEFYFKKISLMLTGEIMSSVNKARVELDSYDADAGIYSVKVELPDVDSTVYEGQGTYGKKILIHGMECFAPLAISSADAQNLKQNGYAFNINMEDIKIKIPLARDFSVFRYHSIPFDEYHICPEKITVISKADTTKKYFLKNLEAEGRDSDRSGVPYKHYDSEIIFKGKYLWKNNLYAANLEFKYSDLVKELQQKQENATQVVKQAAAEQNKKAQEWVAIWTAKDAPKDIKKLTFKLNDGVKYEIAVGNVIDKSNMKKVNNDLKSKGITINDGGALFIVYHEYGGGLRNPLIEINLNAFTDKIKNMKRIGSFNEKLFNFLETE
ncbi:MAG: hypothetical protein LBH98_07295 [Chitinispirillales bacterium]|jgi:hypothetical protein|nr:hypothetical protein [Chitinispirillales bacterium]